MAECPSPLTAIRRRRFLFQPSVIIATSHRLQVPIAPKVPGVPGLRESLGFGNWELPRSRCSRGLRGVSMSIFTTAVHSGHIALKPGQPSNPPIVTASGWAHEKMEDLDAALADERAGYMYSRDA